MWGPTQFDTARQAFKQLQPLFDKLSNISLTRALSVMRIWGSVQQLRGCPYPWGIEGDVIAYEDEQNDYFFEQLRYFWIMALSSYPTAALTQYFGDQGQSECLIEKHFPHVKILIKNNTCDGIIPAHALCADHVNERLILVIRGSAEKADWLINLSCKMQETVCHSGFWKSSNVLLNSIQAVLTEFMENHPTFELHTTGHSLGAAIATVTAMLLKPKYPQVKAWCFAPPKCFNKELAEECKSYVTSICYGRDLIAHACLASVDSVLAVLDEMGQEDDFKLLGQKFVLQTKPSFGVSETVKSPLTTSKTKTFDATTLEELELLLSSRVNCFNQIFGFPLEIRGNNFLEVVLDSLKSSVKRSLLSSPRPELSRAETRRMKDWVGFQSNPPSAAASNRNSANTQSERPSIDWLMKEVVKQVAENRTPVNGMQVFQRQLIDSPISATLDSESDEGLSQACTPHAQDQEELDLESVLHRFLRWSWPSNKCSEQSEIFPEVSTSTSTAASTEINGLTQSEKGFHSMMSCSSEGIDEVAIPKELDQQQLSASQDPEVPSSNSFLCVLVNKVAQSVLAMIDPNKEEDPVREFINEMNSELSEEKLVNIVDVVRAHRKVIGRRFEKSNVGFAGQGKSIDLNSQEAAERLLKRIADRIQTVPHRLFVAGKIIQIIPLEHLVCGDPFWRSSEFSEPNLEFCKQVWDLFAKCTMTNSFPAHVFVHVHGNQQSLFDPLYKISSVEDHMPLAYTRALVPDLRNF